MDRPDVAMFVVGAVGVLVAFVIVQPGEYILELGTLRFDPSLAVISGFGFLAAWGIAMSLQRSTAFQVRVEPTRFNSTAVSIVLSLSLLSAVLTYSTTDLTGVSLIATVLVNILIVVIVLTGVFVLFRHFGWWYPETGNEV